MQTMKRLEPRYRSQPARYYASQLRSLLLPPPTVAELRLMGQVRPYTMIGPARLRTLYRLAQRANRRAINGSFVECGTCNGGSGALLASVAAQTDRQVWLFDSFQGLPEPSSLDGTDAPAWQGGCLGTQDSVEKVLGVVEANRASVQVVKGWFEDTLRAAPVGEIALLHLDGDWYESTRTILEAFYERIAPGGFLVIDDYGHWPGCKVAVDDFFQGRSASSLLTRAKYTGASLWFEKL